MRVRARAKSDRNQQDIMDFLRKCGASVLAVHSIPVGLDIIIGYMGIDQRAEVKDPNQPPSKRKLTEAEQYVFDNWRGRKPVILQTENDVTALLFEMAKGKKP